GQQGDLHAVLLPRWSRIPRRGAIYAPRPRMAAARNGPNCEGTADLRDLLSVPEVGSLHRTDRLQEEPRMYADARGLPLSARGVCRVPHRATEPTSETV